MAGEIVTAGELLHYLGLPGADERDESLVESLRAYAVESLGEIGERPQTYNEAVRLKVWIGYWAVRDPACDTGFLREYLDALLRELRGEEADA